MRDDGWMTTAELENEFAKLLKHDQVRVNRTLSQLTVAEYREVIEYTAGWSVYDGKARWRFKNGHTAESVLALLMLTKSDDAVITMPAVRIEQDWIPGESEFTVLRR